MAVEVVIAAPVRTVWNDLADISTHTEWMADAASIDFVTDQHQGIGTRFECITKVGPFRTTDVMEVTEWDPPSTMGVSHQGLIVGQGRFTLTPSGAATVFAWTEEIRFPWYLGGPLAAQVAAPVLRSIWNANLARLKHRIETP